jgi:O-acetylhomoserine/O-acetylserine sulfhydrylase-like pyridoxal-dependent enzyme
MRKNKLKPAPTVTSKQLPGGDMLIQKEQVYGTRKNLRGGTTTKSTVSSTFINNKNLTKDVLGVKKKKVVTDKTGAVVKEKIKNTKKG